MVTYQATDGIAELRIDDGKVNAMSPTFFDEINAALDQAEREGPGAVVIVGREGCFSAGLNVKLLPTLPQDELIRTLRTFGHTLLRVWAFPIPTVAAVTGHAVAGGLFLALACDLRVVARGPYRLHANEHAIGLPLPTWALAITDAAVSKRTYAEMMLHARPFSPDEAVARGFVTELADPNDVVDRARTLAGPLTALDRRAYALTKRRLRAPALAWAEPAIASEMVGFPGAR